MKTIVITVLLIFVALLSMLGTGQAQTWIPIQGTIQAVDCRTNALVLNARDGLHVFPMAPNATVSIDSTPASFCALRQYIGRSATVSVTVTGSQMVAGGVDVYGAVTPAPVPGYGYYGPAYAAPYCAGPYVPGPYYPAPCYGPYSGYYPYYPYYGPTFSIAIGIGFGPGFRHEGFRHDRDGRFVGPPRFHDGDRRFMPVRRFDGRRRR
jgi:hypothetical protein